MAAWCAPWAVLLLTGLGLVGPRPLRVVLSHWSGNIGNNLLQYAVGLSVAVKLNRSFHVPHHEELQAAFLLSSSSMAPTDVPPLRQLYGLPAGADPLAPGHCNDYYRNPSPNIPRTKDFCFTGVLFNQAAFKSIRPLLLKDLALSTPMLHYTQATLQRLRGAFGPAATFVAVHVRLGDRALTPNWLAPTAEYVVAAVEHVRRLAGNAVFILFTDCAVCSRIMQIRRSTPHVKWHLHSGTAMQALALMVHCTHFVLTGGSFGWWAAYLGETAASTVITCGEYTTEARRNAIRIHKMVPATWKVFHRCAAKASPSERQVITAHYTSRDGGSDQSPAVNYSYSPVERLLGAHYPPKLKSECNFAGWSVGGRSPYCECRPGWTAETCTNRNPLPGRPRGVIAYLLYGAAHYALQLAEVLPLLDRYFNDRYHYPILIFHSDNMAKETMPGTGKSYLDFIRSQTNSSVSFARVEITLPAHVAKWPKKSWQRCTCRHKCSEAALDYRHMCYFFTYMFFLRPELQPYEYVWRMDANLGLTRAVPCDVFQVMRRTNAVFGFYAAQQNEAAQCTGPIGGFAARYAKTFRFQPNHLDRIGPGRLMAYNGAWNVFKWNFFRSKTWQHWAQAVRQSGMVYSHRLGEQTMLLFGLSLLVPPEAIHQFGGLSPLFHNRKQLWRYDQPEMFIRRDDPVCRAVAADNPWSDPPLPYRFVPQPMPNQKHQLNEG